MTIKKGYGKGLTIALILLGTILLFSCSGPGEKSTESETLHTGEIERLSKSIDRMIPKDAKIEVLDSGFTWSEGPLWLEEQNRLIFSDVPNNIVYSYRENDSLSVYLKPSGYTHEGPDNGNSGSNGLLLSPKGDLVLCQHGDRRMARMRASLDNPVPIFQTLADRYDGKRFNSPNDAVYDSEGNLYFTDPPYGLNEQDEDSAKELEINGVYKLTTKGEVVLLTDALSRPNGIALSPDENTLYVANSDPGNCIWMAYELSEDKTIADEAVLFDATGLYDGKNGVPDGMKVASSGHIFATGPGGVLVLSPDGEHLGTIKTGQATANCCFNADESVLYMTAHNYLMRIKLK
ncbi:MAG: SMP-30/gluconolactonase/LRE family protein [bacterium]